MKKLPMLDGAAMIEQNLYDIEWRIANSYREWRYIEATRSVWIRSVGEEP